MNCSGPGQHKCVLAARSKASNNKHQKMPATATAIFNKSTISSERAKRETLTTFDIAGQFQGSAYVRSFDSSVFFPIASKRFLLSYQFDSLSGLLFFSLLFFLLYSVFIISLITIHCCHLCRIVVVFDSRLSFKFSYVFVLLFVIFFFFIYFGFFLCLLDFSSYRRHHLRAVLYEAAAIARESEYQVGSITIRVLRQKNPNAGIQQTKRIV